MKTLIVEDDFTSRLLLQGFLKKYGPSHIAVNGQEAVEAVRMALTAGEPYDLICLDIMMPEMDGQEALRQIRAQEEARGIRRLRAQPTERPPYIILLTSKDEKADIIIGLESGANDYLVKPFDAGELRARVEVGCRMVAMQEALLKSKDLLAYQASHDPLTGLSNRRAIFEQLHRELARADRHGDGLAVGICDLDHFKRINDTHGHQAGDDLLCGFARILKAQVREYDAIGRIGGEEFLIITPVSAGTDCLALFNRLCRRVGESGIATRSGELSVTVSIGVACIAYPRPVDDILEAADSALYRAKKLGRNRVVAHDWRCLAGEIRACAS